MRIDSLRLRYVRLPLRDVFQNRWQRISTWTKLLVEVRGPDGVGYGECMAMETPYYCYETIATAWLAIHEFLAPLLLGKEFEHPSEVDAMLSPISGHHEAKAALECACWELYSRVLGVPLYEVIGGSQRPVSSGATVGVQSDIAAAVERVEQARNEGYARIKIKIKPGWDKELVHAVRQSFPDITILADANGAYGEQDVDWLARLDRYAPIVLEQPFPAGAWRHTAKLQARTEAVVCLDESIHCLDDVEEMLHLDAARLVNLKIGRVGGISAARRIHDRCQEAGVPVFVGSKTETGVGRWTNIAFGTLPNVRFPSDVAASDRYFVEHIVEHPVTLVGPGLVEPRNQVGFGSELDAAKVLEFTVRSVTIE